MDEENHNHENVLSSSRIETLSDGVFCIAMTLLILNIKMPNELNHEGFIKALSNIWPQVSAYFVTFMVLAVYWIGHHNQYLWIKHSDRTFLWINIFFLMFISFLPFSTSLLASYNNEIWAILIYGFNVIISGFCLYLHWIYATGKGNLIHGNLEPKVQKIMGFRILIGIIFYIVSILLGFISPKITLFMFAVVPFLYMIPSRIDAKPKNS